jgi:hypothetical protein
MLRRVGIGIGWITLCVVIATICAEIVTRALARSDLVWTREAYQVREGFVSFRPNARLAFTNERAEAIGVAVDDRGFRNPPGAFERARILLLGDSFAAAVNTPREQTIAGRLSAAGYDVYNSGADGSGTFHQLAILEDALEERAFHDIVLLFYTGNDFHDNFMTVESVVDGVQRRASRLGAAEPSNGKGAVEATGLDYGTIAARPWWRQRVHSACDRLQLCRQIYDNFWLGQVRGYARDPWTNRRYMLMQLLTSAKRAEIDKAIERTRVALRAMKALAARRGSRLTIVAAPSRSEVLRSWYDMVASASIDRKDLLELTRAEQIDYDRPERTIRLIARELQIGYHALLGDLRRDPMPARLYGIVDGHWMAEGQRVAAASIQAYLEAAGIGAR